FAVRLEGNRHYPVHAAAEVCCDLASIAEGGVQAAIGVVADQGEVPTGRSNRNDLAVALYGYRPHFAVDRTGEIRANTTTGAESGIELQCGCVAYDEEVGESWIPPRTDDIHLAVWLKGQPGDAEIAIRRRGDSSCGPCRVKTSEEEGVKV